MRLAQLGSTLTIADLADLNSGTSAELRHAIRSRLSEAVEAVEIDLSGTGHLDCAGIGALIRLKKALGGQSAAGCLGLRNATPNMRRLLNLTRTEQIFHIT